MVRGSKSSRKKGSGETVVKVPHFVRKMVGCKYRDVEYSIDDKRILVLAGTEVRVIDAKTGRLSTTLQGHESRITSVALSWSNHLQVITSSTDGTLRIWDLEDGACLKIKKLGSDVQRVVTTSMDPSHCYVLLTKSKEWEVVQIKNSIDSGDDDEEEEERVVLARGEIVTSEKKKKKKKKHKKKKYPKITTTGRYLCVVDREQMEVFDVVEGRLAASYEHNREITAASICPTEAMIAVGDSSGKIHLWHGLPTSPDDDTAQTSTVQLKKKATTVVLHWHAHEVKTLAFGHQGLQLFSGGDEAVLVIWQLESRDLNFLPRLGGALNTIRTSRDGMSLCVCCDNNSVRVVNITTLATIWQQSGLTTLANSATKYRKRCGNAIVDPITDAVVIPTCNGGAGASLQFWNAKDDTCMALLDVSYRNRVSRKESGRKNRAPRAIVEAFDFSEDGSWLVTVDCT